MKEITKIQKVKAGKCSFAGCEISSGDDVYFVTIGKKKLPFCHDCATRLGELFNVEITGDAEIDKLEALTDREVDATLEKGFNFTIYRETPIRFD